MARQYHPSRDEARPPVPPLPEGGPDDAGRLANYLRANRTKYEISAIDAELLRVGWDIEIVGAAWRRLLADEPLTPPSRAAVAWRWLEIILFVAMALLVLIWAASTTVTFWPATP